MAKKFRDLTRDERAFICNGCGQKGGKIKPPDFVFKDSCDHHDYNYFLGFTETHRKKADKQFYKAMRDQIKGCWWYTKPALHATAFIYYRAVRHCGKGAFHYGTEEQEF